MAEAKKEKTSHSTGTKEHSETKKESPSSGLYRSETNKVIAGVAGGLGEYFNVDPTIIRILFVLMAVFGGSGFIIYIVLWLIIPTKSNSQNSQDAIRSNIEDMKSTTTSFAHSLQKGEITKGKQSLRSDDLNSRYWWAIIIIVVGFLFLMRNYGLLGGIEFNKLWPLVLIIFGLAIILRK